MCNLFLFNCFTKNSILQKAKPFSLHCSLVLLVLGYAFFGGFVFNRIESKLAEERRIAAWNQKKECVQQVLSTLSTWALYAPWRNHTTNTISHCFVERRDERDDWSFVTATLYGFGIVTTLGYNRIAPATYTGRMFCIVYGICGIPVTMIIIANIGRYLHSFAGSARKKIEQYRTNRLRSKAVKKGKEYQETSTEVTSLILLAVFMLYVAFGAVLLPALNGQVDFFNGLYYNFLCLTALDFGQLVPTRLILLPITFLYVCLGLAITTIAIEIGSEYMKKLHYIGMRIKSVATTKIWFGSKSLIVKDLLHAVGKKCGVESKVIDAIDLDTLVENTIAINEGKLVEEDKDVENPPTEPSPTPPSTPGHPSPLMRRDKGRNDLRGFRKASDLLLYQSFYESQFGQLKSPPKTRKITEHQLISCEFNSPIPARATEERFPVDVFEPESVEYVMIKQPLLAEPIATPSVSPNPSLKTFRDKKEAYRRDPQKLYETYQEEWNRMNRISPTGSSRRRSSSGRRSSPKK